MSDTVTYEYSIQFNSEPVDPDTPIFQHLEDAVEYCDGPPECVVERKWSIGTNCQSVTNWYRLAESEIT